MDEATGARGRHDAGPELSEGIDHLQRAARELVAAARSFLDVVEHVVEDDERLAGAASSIADLVGRGLGSTTGRDLADGLLGGLAGREPSWLRNDPDHPDAPDHTAAPGRDGGGADVDDVDLYFGDASVDLAGPSQQTPAKKSTAKKPRATNAAAKKVAAKKSTAKKPPATNDTAKKVAATPRTRRVTRISVD